jgi:hypothetical protein
VKSSLREREGGESASGFGREARGGLRGRCTLSFCSCYRISFQAEDENASESEIFKPFVSKKI